MKAKYLLILHLLFLFSCNKEQKEYEALKKSRKDILEVHIFNRSSHKITKNQISVINEQFELSNTVMMEDLEPSGKTMFLYDCREKIPYHGPAGLGIDIRCQLDSNQLSTFFGGITQGTLFVRSVNCNVYEDYIQVDKIYWMDY